MSSILVALIGEAVVIFAVASVGTAVLRSRLNRGGRETGGREVSCEA